jgi:hypothetical protein
MDEKQIPQGCRWIDGEPTPRAPGRSDWSYCQRRTLPGSSWCAEHRARVYMRRL